MSRIPGHDPAPVLTQHSRGVWRSVRLARPDASGPSEVCVTPISSMLQRYPLVRRFRHPPRPSMSRPNLPGRELYHPEPGIPGVTPGIGIPNGMAIPIGMPIPGMGIPMNGIPNMLDRPELRAVGFDTASEMNVTSWLVPHG
jgi:hypothetical protein